MSIHINSNVAVHQNTEIIETERHSVEKAPTVKESNQTCDVSCPDDRSPILESDIQCHFCSLVFKDLDSLQMHNNKIHINHHATNNKSDEIETQREEVYFSCEKCTFRGNAEQASDHKNSHSKQENQFNCSHCNITFTTNKDTHTGAL